MHIYEYHKRIEFPQLNWRLYATAHISTTQTLRKVVSSHPPVFDVGDIYETFRQKGFHTVVTYSICATDFRAATVTENQLAQSALDGTTKNNCFWKAILGSLFWISKCNMNICFVLFFLFWEIGKNY